MNEISLIQRAFELAQAGSCANLKDLRSRLKREGYANFEIYHTLAGKLTQQQLRTIIEQASEAA